MAMKNRYVTNELHNEFNASTLLSKSKRLMARNRNNPMSRGMIWKSANFITTLDNNNDNHIIIKNTFSPSNQCFVYPSQAIQAMGRASITESYSNAYGVNIRVHMTSTEFLRGSDLYLDQTQ